MGAGCSAVNRIARAEASNKFAPPDGLQQASAKILPNNPQHQRMRRLQHGSIRLEVIVDPAREHRGIHSRVPRLGHCPHPAIQIVACSENRSLGVSPAIAVLHAVADLTLVNIQTNVNT
jgi:hypothetical protein